MTRVYVPYGQWARDVLGRIKGHAAAGIPCECPDPRHAGYLRMAKEGLIVIKGGGAAARAVMEITRAGEAFLAA